MAASDRDRRTKECLLFAVVVDFRFQARCVEQRKSCLVQPFRLRASPWLPLLCATLVLILGEVSLQLV